VRVVDPGEGNAGFAEFVTARLPALLRHADPD
jgi:hypothetical protein